MSVFVNLKDIIGGALITLLLLWLLYLYAHMKYTNWREARRKVKAAKLKAKAEAAVATE